MYVGEYGAGDPASGDGAVASERFNVSQTCGAAKGGGIHEGLEAMIEAPEASGEETFGKAAVAVGPNPVSGDATFSFTLGTAAALRLALYDAVGREVAVVAEGRYQAGAHRESIEVGALPSGVYFWRLTGSDRRAESGQLTIVR